MANVNVTVRLDENLKKQAEELFSDLGISFTAALTVFMKQAVRQQAIPFVIGRDVPNRETMEAIEEARILKSDPNKKTYNSFEEILKEIDDEI